MSRYNVVKKALEYASYIIDYRIGTLHQSIPYQSGKFQGVNHSPETGGSYDCVSFVMSCYNQAGRDCGLTAYEYSGPDALGTSAIYSTGAMVSGGSKSMTGIGFKDVTSQCDLGGGSYGFKPGDVIVFNSGDGTGSNGHTELVYSTTSGGRVIYLYGFGVANGRKGGYYGFGQSKVYRWPYQGVTVDKISF